MKGKRNLALNQRNEEVREKRGIKVIELELNEIFDQFNENIESIKDKFNTADKLLEGNDNEIYNDILRSQIVFLDSALDYYMHCITKYGMNKMFRCEWKKTDKYNNFLVPLIKVEYVIKNTEDATWFIELVNNTYAKETFMEANSIKSQLSLIGINFSDIAKDVCFEESNMQKQLDKLKSLLNSLFYRRNAIAHQSDRLHEDGRKKEITKEDVEHYINDVEKIVVSIQKEIENKNLKE